MINTSMDALVWLRKQLETEDNDLLREMVSRFAEGLMSAEADVVCGASYGEVSPERTNRRNRYRTRRWDTRVGSIDLPKLRAGSYFSDWLLDARTRSERGFIQVVAEGEGGPWRLDSTRDRCRTDSPIRQMFPVTTDEAWRSATALQQVLRLKSFTAGIEA